MTGTHINGTATAVNGANLPIDRSNSLGDLVARILAEHEAVGTATRSIIKHAMAAGDLLIEAEKQVKHGERERWYRESCGISPRRAQVYMQLARGRAIIEANPQRAADLSIRAALKTLELPKAAVARNLKAKPEERASKRPSSALSSLAWSESTPADRTAFLNNVGVKAIWDAMGPGQRQAIVAYALEQTTDDAEELADAA
jgi:hypothetical protein